MTHSTYDAEEARRVGTHPGGIRLSVGLEHPEDLRADLEHALDAMPNPASCPLAERTLPRYGSTTCQTPQPVSRPRELRALVAP